jgi:hypothetical protein
MNAIVVEQFAEIWHDGWPPEKFGVATGRTIEETNEVLSTRPAGMPMIFQTGRQDKTPYPARGARLLKNIEKDKQKL